MGLLSPELSSPGCLGGQGEGGWAKRFLGAPLHALEERPSA